MVWLVWGAAGCSGPGASQPQTQPGVDACAVDPLAPGCVAVADGLIFGDGGGQEVGPTPDGGSGDLGADGTGSPDGACVPHCQGKMCGDDGCGGSCGSCAAGQVCSAAGVCGAACTPQCGGKSCGDDGCGGSCGTCPGGQLCDAFSHCVTTCTPSCQGKICGDDGCGGSCGTCQGGQTCTPQGQCQAACVPSCLFKDCGDDGCGGSCGTCAAGQTCNALAGTCEGGGTTGCGDVTYEGCCTADGMLQYCDDTTGTLQTLDCATQNPQCGWSSTGGYYDCGTDGGASTDPSLPLLCGGGSCVPSCAGKACGSDGCGGTCGTCAAGQTCDASGQCQAGTCACGNLVCGMDPTGTCSCGTCPAGTTCSASGLSCDPTTGGGLGAYCGSTDGCTTKVDDPNNPGQQMDNPNWPDCVHAQCASGLCLGAGTPGALVNLPVCSKTCTITKDSNMDGVEDADAPSSDCDGFAAGPAGASARCVEFAPASSGQSVSLCVPTSTFSTCAVNADCPAGEQCLAAYVFDHFEERCVAKVQAGAWGTVSKMTEPCNEDASSGALSLCESGWCFGVGCVDSCQTDADCDTTQLFPGTGCDQTSHTCLTMPSRSCTVDADCSRWDCGLKDTKIFGDSSSYVDDFCWPLSCTGDADCGQGFYCRYNWNGDYDAQGEPVWDHICLPQASGGVAKGEACDPDPTDAVPGPTCLNEDYCVGGFCGGMCGADSDCATASGQQCVVTQFTAPKADGSDGTLYLDWCETFLGSGAPCTAEADCDGTGASEQCDVALKSNHDATTQGDGPMLLESLCITSDATAGALGDACSSYADCEAGWCLGADQATGTQGFCTQVCDGAASCPSITSGTTSYHGICTSLLYSFAGDQADDATNVYLPLCQFTTASLADCSADFTCPAGEACAPNVIATDPASPATVELLCMHNDNGASGPAADAAVGAACDPNATNTDGSAQAQCASGLCLDEAAGAPALGYCSALCAGPSDTTTCPAGLTCQQHVIIPRAGSFAANEGAVYLCKKP